MNKDKIIQDAIEKASKMNWILPPQRVKMPDGKERYCSYPLMILSEVEKVILNILNDLDSISTLPELRSNPEYLKHEKEYEDMAEEYKDVEDTLSAPKKSFTHGEVLKAILEARNLELSVSGNKRDLSTERALMNLGYDIDCLPSGTMTESMIEIYIKNTLSETKEDKP